MQKFLVLFLFISFDLYAQKGFYAFQIEMDDFIDLDSNKVICRASHSKAPDGPKYKEDQNLEPKKVAVIKLGNWVKEEGLYSRSETASIRTGLVVKSNEEYQKLINENDEFSWYGKSLNYSFEKMQTLQKESPHAVDYKLEANLNEDGVQFKVMKSYNVFNNTIGSAKESSRSVMTVSFGKESKVGDISVFCEKIDVKADSKEVKRITRNVFDGHRKVAGKIEKFE